MITPSIENSTLRWPEINLLIKAQTNSMDMDEEIAKTKLAIIGDVDFKVEKHLLESTENSNTEEINTMRNSIIARLECLLEQQIESVEKCNRPVFQYCYLAEKKE
jgi:hypothetical protein